MNEDRANGTGAWLAFEVAGQAYAVPLAEVHEIIRPETPAPVPGAPTDVLGIISLRGSIVTVLDGCRRLGLDGGGRGPDERLLVFRGADENVGLRIDALRDVMDLDLAELMPRPPGAASRDDDPVLGVPDCGDEFVTLLDADKLCRPHQPAMEASA
jgi:purine-binding chemotaxis protein CheW